MSAFACGVGLTQRERAYRVNNYTIRFNIDDCGCMCDFPQADEETMTLQRIKASALLGAAVAMAKSGVFEDEFVFIPRDMPAWIVDAVNKITLEEQCLDGLSVVVQE